MGSCCRRRSVCSFLQAPVAFFRRDHPYHLEDVGLEAHSPHLGHHGRGHGLVAGEGAELVHLVLEKERVFAAAFQQGRRRTLGEGGVLRLGAVHHHDLQLVGLGFGQLFGKADLGTLGDELLRPLAQFELIALHLEHAAQHHHGILEAGQRGAQLVEVFVAVGGGGPPRAEAPRAASRRRRWCPPP